MRAEDGQLMRAKQSDRPHHSG